MPGLDLTVATRLTPNPRDMSPALAIALPMMKSVMSAKCFENMAYNNDKTETEEDSTYDSKATSRRESIGNDTVNAVTIAVNNLTSDKYIDRNNVSEERTDARTPLLKNHKIESLDETKLREYKMEKRKSSAST